MSPSPPDEPFERVVAVLTVCGARVGEGEIPGQATFTTRSCVVADSSLQKVRQPNLHRRMIKPFADSCLVSFPPQAGCCLGSAVAGATRSLRPSAGEVLRRLAARVGTLHDMHDRFGRAGHGRRQDVRRRAASRIDGAVGRSRSAPSAARAKSQARGPRPSIFSRSLLKTAQQV